jgi:hypothetical protein
VNHESASDLPDASNMSDPFHFRFNASRLCNLSPDFLYRMKND